MLDRSRSAQVTDWTSIHLLWGLFTPRWPHSWKMSLSHLTQFLPWFVFSWFILCNTRNKNGRHVLFSFILDGQFSLFFIFFLANLCQTMNWLHLCWRTPSNICFAEMVSISKNYLKKKIMIWREAQRAFQTYFRSRKLAIMLVQMQFSKRKTYIFYGKREHHLPSRDQIGQLLVYNIFNHVNRSTLMKLCYFLLVPFAVFANSIYPVSLSSSSTSEFWCTIFFLPLCFFKS